MTSFSSLVHDSLWSFSLPEIVNSSQVVMKRDTRDIQIVCSIRMNQYGYFESIWWLSPAVIWTWIVGTGKRCIRIDLLVVEANVVSQGRSEPSLQGTHLMCIIKPHQRLSGMIRTAMALWEHMYLQNMFPAGYFRFLMLGRGDISPPISAGGISNSPVFWFLSNMLEKQAFLFQQVRGAYI